VARWSRRPFGLSGIGPFASDSRLRPEGLRKASVGWLPDAPSTIPTPHPGRLPHLSHPVGGKPSFPCVTGDLWVLLPDTGLRTGHSIQPEDHP
jgi:hypothetical protein